MSSLTNTSEWQALKNHHNEIHSAHLKEFFDIDPQRFEKFSLHETEIFIDYSKNHVTEKTIELLCALARAQKLENAIQDMFNGVEINCTEKRAALHIALRNLNENPDWSNNNIFMSDIKAVLTKMSNLATQLQNNTWPNIFNKPITDIVTIGIGGSELGPALALEALHSFTTNKFRFHFISNIDNTHVLSILKQLDPTSTLFIVSSKSFTTLETLSHLTEIQNWFYSETQSDQWAKNFIAVTANPQKALEKGFLAKNIFSMWDWVGGRYSIWSAIGLPLVIGIGMKNFTQLLEGAHSIDRHFYSRPLHKNIPIILGLLSIWYINFFETKAHAILPYDESLKLLPQYLQQMGMESNGKQVTHDGRSIDYPTSSVIFGQTGTKGQHSFFQLLHQGTHLIPADFIISLKSHYDDDKYHAFLVANALSQSNILMKGKTYQEIKNEMQAQGFSLEEINRLSPHKLLPGNRPSNTILLNKLTPFTLGSLLALYEHKTYVESVIWQINAFDQWGIEEGKKVALAILPNLLNGKCQSFDSSTNALIRRYYESNK